MVCKAWCWAPRDRESDLASSAFRELQCYAGRRKVPPPFKTKQGAEMPLRRCDTVLSVALGHH